MTNTFTKPSSDTNMLRGVLQAYCDYESKIISKHELFDAVRDVYYLNTVGDTYEDYLTKQRSWRDK